MTAALMNVKTQVTMKLVLLGCIMSKWAKDNQNQLIVMGERDGALPVGEIAAGSNAG